MNGSVKKIESIDDAIELEQDIEKSFHHLIRKLLDEFVETEKTAQREYERMAAESRDERSKFALSLLGRSERRHAKLLDVVIKILEEIASETEEHAEILRSLKNTR